MPTLEWIGKKAVLNHHRQVPYHLLQSEDILSIGDPDSGNLLVRGDNLLALKALLPFYAGKTKCIYIELSSHLLQSVKKSPIIKLVQTILADPDNPSVPQLETEIDQLIYTLYNLTTEDIKLIESSNKRDK